MKKKLHFINFLFSLFFSVAMMANTNGDPIKKDSTAIKAITKIVKAKSTKTFRNFSSLKKFDKVAAAVSKQRFTEQGFQFNTADSTENKKWLDKATNTFKKVEELGNYIEFLTKDGLGQLPVAIKPVSISNVKYTVGIAKAVFKPAFTELTVFLKVELPSTNDKRGDQVLILGASNVKLSHTGGIIGDAKLNLISQFTTNFNQGSVLLTLKGGFDKPGTYAIIDCSGFKEMGLDANIKFADGLLHPVDEKGKKKIGYVEADFKTTIADWNDMVVNISLPEFGVKGLEGTTFQLNTAVFDFSDLRNDEATPKAYLNKYYSGTPNLWRGVYVKSLKVILPQEFKTKKEKDTRVAFGASDLIIDGQGVTGKFIGENIIKLKEGSASGWDFSLDYFMLDIETNNLKAGEFKGKLVLPVSQLDSLKYHAVFQPGEYKLRVETAKDIDFDVFNAAKVHLTKDSYVEMKVKDGNFRPKAVLHGDLTINTSISKKSTTGTSASATKKKKEAVSFEGIEFQNMVLQTESPMFSADYFGTKGRLGLAGFPVSINKIGLKTPGGNRAELFFDLEVNLMSSSDGGNGGSTQLAIKGKLGEAGNKWKFDGVRLEKLHIKMDIAGTQLQGAIFIFDEDPTYGTGFAGAVGAKFSKGLKLEVQAKALFGRTETFRYWFADAQVTIPAGIPVFTGFALNSFGGGMYSRMKMDGVSKKADAAFEEIGASTSGVVYVPYEGNALGMKASVGITTQGSEDLFHATVEFGMAFRKSGGLQEIYFKGHGELMSPLPDDYYDVLESNLSAISDEAVEIPNKQTSAAISADVFIGFDFVNDIFQSTSEVYINLGVVKGVGPSGRAGWLDFYVAPDEWHLLIGTPEDRIGIEIDLAILKVKMDSYFMTGDNLPGSPPPPAIVADILGVDVADLDYMRDLNMLESGYGLAFGASLSVTTGDLTFLIFYARFDAGVGFDIMLKDYGDAHCKGSSEPIGMNGWYANGQAYAYLQGELGLTFRLFGSKKKIPIISGGGAVLLQARLPNPAWFRGYLGGRYNLLGGLIKGRFRFKVELGDKCEVVGGSPLGGVVVIGDLKPKDASTEVDVFAAPKAVFNLQINKIFEIPDETGDRKYKILLDEFSVKNNGAPIKGEVKWNDKNDVAVFYSHEILPPNAQLKAYVQLHFEEFKNGTWEIMKADGKVATETKEVNFTTGEAPKTIPLNNIAYMYPVLGQQNLFIEEYGTAYINLKRGQSYLFDAVPDWEKTMAMSSGSGTTQIKPYTYSPAKKQIVYSLPRDMTNETAYNVTIKLVSEGSNNDNVSETYNTKDIGSNDAENTAEVKSKTADEAATKDGERELLTYNFRTSEYDTFKDKMDDMDINNDLYDHVDYPYGLTLLAKIDQQEPFDLLELRGNEYSGNVPLVVVRAVLEDSYYKKQIYPLLYQNYPLAGELEVNRETDKVGVPPVEGVEPMTWYLTYLENGDTGETSLYNPYRYNLTYYYLQDYEDLSYQLVNSTINWQSNPTFSKLVTDAFPYMRKGKYKTTFKYILPGQVKQGRDNIVKYINPINE